MDRALSLSGDNRDGLEKVLLYYSNDSFKTPTTHNLKYQAAEYLIRYMPYYSYREVLPEFEMVFDSLAQLPVGDDALLKSTYIDLLDSVSDKGKTQPGMTKYDIQEVSADYLI